MTNEDRRKRETVKDEALQDARQAAHFVLSVSHHTARLPGTASIRSPSHR